MRTETDIDGILKGFANAGDMAAGTAAMKMALRGILSFTAFDAGWMRIHSEKGEIRVSADCGEEMSGFCFSELQPPDCVCGTALGGGTEALSAEISNRFCADNGFNTAVCVPAVSDGKPVGFIFLAAREKNAKEAELMPVRIVADHAALMVARITHNSEMEKRLKTLQTVSRVGAIISSQLTLKELTQAVVEHLGKVIATDRVNMVLYNSKDDTLEFIASFISGEGARTDEPEVYPLSDGMNSWIVRNRRPLLIKEDTVSECEKRGIRHGGKPAMSWLGVPMVHNGKIAGALSIQSYSRPNLYDETSIEMLSLVAGQVVVAVENARLYEATARREKEKQQIYYSLTHDLLSFLTPVSGYGDLLRRMSPEELTRRKDEIGKSILDSSSRITQFVEDILIFSKIQAGKLTLHTDAVNIYNIIDRSVSNFFSELTIRNLDVYIEGKKTEKASMSFPKKVVTCDTLQIERVFNNCIQNAVKHANSRVDVLTRADSSEIYCTVADDGEGMPKELVKNVFDEYYQMDHGKKGVGLGLPSVKRIVEQHGGKVWVETDKGKGFSFTFSLPAVKVV